MSILHADKFFAPIAPKLEAVEAELRKMVQSEIPVVRRLAEYVSNGGKRVRPVLVLLASKFCGYDKDEDIRYSAIFELMHTATLIHDDVIDHAPIRRGHSSLNAKWGNTLSILFGDFLFLQATQNALAGRDWRILELLTDAATKMIEGELIQNDCLYSLGVTKQTYFDILERKTAFVFAGCAKTSAILAGKDEAVCHDMFKFGMGIGRAFQLVDDLLDYTSTSDQLGKPAFSDLREGKLTLPILSLLEKAPDKATPIVKRVWENDSPAIPAEDANMLQELLKQYGTLDETRELAKQASKTACDSLPIAAGNPQIAELLQEIPETLLERSY